MSAIDVLEVVDGKPISSFVKLSDFVSADIKVDNCIPMLSFRVHLSGMDQTFAVWCFRSDYCLVIEEHCTAVRLPIPKVFLSHWEEEEHILNGSVVRVSIVTLVE